VLGHDRLLTFHPIEPAASGQRAESSRNSTNLPAAAPVFLP
jgi:hypothetical protein